ncbi:hypothetical protein [Sphingobacterium lactis]|uniref:FUSC family protein n=1 Tax=Sphingobacterium lactis TaxID=797291 RepID=A0A1H5ZYH9_9SPHI|nr:hypothetical protein [Sphingobacterium lactis]SEG41182.1 hypothetical protein SAMN05421877_107237 [Sphingobacterium lactis]
MSESNLNLLTDEELLGRKKKAKSSQIISAVLIGFLVGIAVYSTINKGIGFFTFFPLFFVFLLVKNSSDIKNIEQEIKKRNLN